MSERALRSALERYWLIGLLVALELVLLVVARRPAVAPVAAVAPPAAASSAASASPAAAVAAPAVAPAGPRAGAADLAAVKSVLPASGLAYHVDVVAFGSGQAVFSGTKAWQATVPAGAALTISGWAVDKPAGAPGTAVALLLDGKTRVPGRIGAARPDVASALGSAALTDCGFSVRVPPALLPRGPHAAALLVLDAKRSGVYRTADVVRLDVR